MLTIYIEGDGLAWLNSSTPSDDPTPMDPLALKLALRDDAPSAYLARPCQYAADDRKKSCAQKYWTHSRFSEEVIQSGNQAIDQIKHKFAAKKLVLVGYSGGGAVAALIAARRLDVARLITIAGNIDHLAWTRKYHLSPLSGSLNPADEWIYLQHIPQTHFIGGKDEVIGGYVARSYASHFPADLQPSIVVVPQYDHHCCWVDNWPALKKDAVSGKSHN
jgi:dienelactone hydrolase